MSRLLVRNGVFHRGLFRGGLGEDQVAPVVAESDPRIATILRKLEEQDRARKWTLIIGGASALFAAVKLGLVTFGHIRSRSSGD